MIYLLFMRSQTKRIDRIKAEKDDDRSDDRLRWVCMYLFTKKNSDEIVRYPRCIPPWNSMIATNSAIETSRST